MTLKNDLKIIKRNLKAIYDILEKHPELENRIKKDVTTINNISCSTLRNINNILNDDIESIQPGLFEEDNR